MSGSSDPGPNTQALIDTLTADLNTATALLQQVVDYLHWLDFSSNVPGTQMWTWHP